MARVRSPNYPALSLPAAIERVRTLHGKEGKNPMSRDVIVKHLGFGSLNGASATILSGLNKYGLLESNGDGEARVSDLAMSILYSHNEDEKQMALREAAFRPSLFSKIHEKWPERPPSDENLRSFLVREGFSASAADQVIQFYRETLEIAAPSASRHDSSSVQVPQEDKMMPASTAMPANERAPVMPPALAGKPFAIGIDGDVLTGTIAIRSLRDFDRMMKVLNAQRIALEAVLEDEEGEDV